LYPKEWLKSSKDGAILPVNDYTPKD